MNKQKILVVSYIYSKQAEESCMGLISEAVRLAEETAGEAEALILGQYTESTTIELSKLGASKLYVMKESSSQEEIYLRVVEKLIGLLKPEIVLFTSSIMTKNIASRLAAKFHTGLTADCISFSIQPDTKKIIQIRPALENRVMAHIVCCNSGPQMATALGDQFKKQQRGDKKTEIKILPEDYVSTNTKEKIHRNVEDERGGILDSTDIIVTVGRGATEPEVLSQIFEFAEITGARLGATRAVVNEGILDYKYQIGLTGRSVSCNLYFAFGVSGASQHLIGIRNAKTIIAVNQDSESDMIRQCHYGIIGDLKEVIPEMITYAKRNKEYITSMEKRRG